jgi:hypothetical protein
MSASVHPAERSFRAELLKNRKFLYLPMPVNIREKAAFGLAITANYYVDASDKLHYPAEAFLSPAGCRVMKIILGLSTKASAVSGT